jgi:hypothetical protein
MGKFVEVIEPLPKVLGVETVMVLTCGGGGVGATPPPTASMMGVQGLPHEVALVTSITTH